MSRPDLRNLLIAVCIAGVVLADAAPVQGQVSSQEVLEAIERGKKFLVSQQRRDSSKKNGARSVPDSDRFPVGITCLALLALINSGMTADQATVASGLAYLRSVEEPQMTYEISLVLMVLAAAKDGPRDNARMASLVRKLEESQIKGEQNPGGWTYAQRGGLIDLIGDGDPSNSQFAVLGLREAQHAGIPVSRRTWELAADYWTNQQGPDGGWSYAGPRDARSTGSMTVAGVSCLIITEALLRDVKDEEPDGTPICCGQPPPDNALKRGIAWLEREGNFSVRHNPGSGSSLLYYLYGLERAGRLSGRRFFGQHDWYREGADFLLKMQVKRLGCWRGIGPQENDPVIGTSMALLFLSKGMAPVLINKLKYGPRDHGHGRGEKVVGEQWNVHPHDVQNLTEMISGLPEWPKLLTSQQVDIGLALAHGGVQDLMQAPILFFNGADDPGFNAREVELLRDYVNQGGFIFAEAACSKTGFDRAFHELIGKMYPQGDYKLKRLPADHPVFRSEYLIDAETTELWGIDVGCRTSIMYSPHDLACLWDKWTVVDPPERSTKLKSSIVKANRVGVNIVAYATGREPPKKLDRPDVVADQGEQQIQRGYLQIAKLRHSGGWDSAPHALRNLVQALNAYAGVAASTQQKNLLVSDPNLFKFPVVYMHGRNRFQLTRPERDRLSEYLQRGGVLFADACCGDPHFDASFRELVQELYPNQKLKRIPPNHEMFTTAIGHDLQRVRRREPESQNLNTALKTNVIEGEPFLEGIEADGRYVVIYSKYDISCALERQASVACSGYVHEDAVKLAVNVVLYALLQ